MPGNMLKTKTFEKTILDCDGLRKDYYAEYDSWKSERNLLNERIEKEKKRLDALDGHFYAGEYGGASIETLRVTFGSLEPPPQRYTSPAVEAAIELRQERKWKNKMAALRIAQSEIEKLHKSTLSHNSHNHKSQTPTNKNHPKNQHRPTNQNHHKNQHHPTNKIRPQNQNHPAHQIHPKNPHDNHASTATTESQNNVNLIFF